MSGLTQAEYASVDILNPRRWVYTASKDTLQCLDPATGAPLKTDEPPLWLASDPRLAEGYEALGHPERAHRLLIALGRHEVASDLGRWRWFERAYSASGVYAFEESDGWDPDAWEEVISELEVMKAQHRLPPGLAKSNRHSDRMLRARLNYGRRPEFSYDIAKTEQPIDKLLLEMTNPSKGDSRLAEFDFSTRAILQFCAGALREWYFPGKYMHEQLKLGLSPIPPTLLTIGAAHRDVLRKFEVCGFRPRVKNLPLSKEAKEEVELYTQAMRLGRVDAQTLGRISARYFA